MKYYKVKGIKHTVYDTESEVPPHVNIVRDWRMGGIDDWVLTDDKSVIQILRKGSMLRKNGERGYIGTCTGTFLVLKDTYMDANKRTNIYSFGGDSTPEQVVMNRRKMTANEELFVQYLRVMSPEDAYVRAFPTNNKQYARMKAVNLIKTERIKTAVKEELKPVLDELEIDAKMVLEDIKLVAQTSDKDETKLRALFKLADILDLEDKNAPRIQQITGVQFQGLTDSMIEEAERPKEIENK
jgi:hypothetical protein